MKLNKQRSRLAGVLITALSAQVTGCNSDTQNSVNDVLDTSMHKTFEGSNPVPSNMLDTSNISLELSVLSEEQKRILEKFENDSSALSELDKLAHQTSTLGDLINHHKTTDAQKKELMKVFNAGRKRIDELAEQYSN